MEILIIPELNSWNCTMGHTDKEGKNVHAQRS
jgi:hypothetical protein